MTNAPHFPDHLDDDLDIDSGIASTSRRSSGMMGAAQSRLLDMAEEGKSELAKGLDGIVTLANEIAARIEGAGAGPVATYARQAAGAIRNLQHGINDRAVEDLLNDGRELVRRHPQAAVGVAVVAGFVVARLLKSSQD